MASDHVANVFDGKGVIGHVEHRIAFCLKRCDQLVGIFPIGIDADKHPGHIAFKVPVVEFGDASFSQGLEEGKKAPGAFRNRDRHQPFPLFPDFGPFRHMAKATEVDVGSAQNRNQRFASNAGLLHIFLGASDPECARRFCDGAGIVENILDRCTDLIRRDGDDFIDQGMRQMEGFLANLFYGNAVGKEPDLTQGHPPAGFHGAGQAIGVFRFDPDNPDFGTNELDVGGDSCDQSTATHRNEDRMNLSRVLAKNFHANRSLAGNDIGVIIWMDECHPFFF